MKRILPILLLSLPLLASGYRTYAEAPDGSASQLNSVIADSKLSDQQRMYKLFDLIFQQGLADYPESATFLGYPGDHGRWTDLSPEALAVRQQRPQAELEALSGINTEALDAGAKLDYQLATKALEETIEQYKLYGPMAAGWGSPAPWPISQMSGVHIDTPAVISAMPTGNVAQYEDIISRLRGLPALFDQTVEMLKVSKESGLMPPKVVLERAADQVAGVLAQDLSASSFLTPFKRFPDTVSKKDQKRLRKEAEKAVQEGIIPAYQKLQDYMTSTYIPAAKEDISASSLPDGGQWYEFAVRNQTTTELTAQQIHNIGLQEVKRIRKLMEATKDKAKFKGSLEEFFTFLRTDPQFYFDKPEELLRSYRDIAKRIDPELVKVFGKLPRLPYGVIPVPDYAEKTTTTAYYFPGAAELGRPGYFFANTYDLKTRPKWEMVALTLHEAVPGHHLQIALAQEQEEKNDLIKNQFYNAFIEGWGLYSESLGEEMGMYEDPYDKFGQLTYEMWRAVRLVVDTGMHSMGWSRQKAIDYFVANAGKSEHDIIVEIDRYIAMPGQALAYKIGELKIKELRAYATKELGEKFDLRAFHDAVLENGALPLDVLEQKIHVWVEAVKSA